MAGCKARCSPDPMFAYGCQDTPPEALICCMTATVYPLDSDVPIFSVIRRDECSGDPNNPNGYLGTNKVGGIPPHIGGFGTDGIYYGFGWLYNCNTKEVRLAYSKTSDYGTIASVVSGTLYVPYDWYIDVSHEIPGINGNTERVVLTIDCYTVDLDCTSIDCFPDCISSTLECDGVTPAHSLLFVDIDQPGKAWDGLHSFYFDEAQNKYYLEIVGGGLRIYITLGCETGVPVLRTAIYSEVREEWLRNEYSQSMVCNAVPAEIQDITFTLSWNNVGVSINAECTIFSNNNGLR